MVRKLVVGESRDKNSEAKGKCSWESFKVDQGASKFEACFVILEKKGKKI
jgi:hypothetical protein